MTKQYDYNKRWRQSHSQTRNKGKARNYALGAKHNRNGGNQWSDEDNRRIMMANRPTDRELAKELGRTVRAIQIQRSRLRAT